MIIFILRFRFYCVPYDENNPHMDEDSYLMTDKYGTNLNIIRFGG